MEGSKLGHRKWAIAIYMMSTSLKATSSMKIHRELGIMQKSAWHLQQRIRTLDQVLALPPPSQRAWWKRASEHPTMRMNQTEIAAHSILMRFATWVILAYEASETEADIVK